MVAINKNDHVRGNIFWQGKGSQGAENVIDLVVGAIPQGLGYTNEEFLVDVAAWITKLFNDYFLRLSNDWSTVEQSWFNVTQNQDIGMTNVTRAGDSSTDAESPQVAALITTHTFTPKHVGKKFLPGIIDTELIEGNWSVDVLAKLAGFAAHYVAGFLADAVPGTWVIPVVYGVVDHVIHWISDATIRPYPGSQRRRRLMTPS